MWSISGPTLDVHGAFCFLSSLVGIKRDIKHVVSTPKKYTPPRRDFFFIVRGPPVTKPFVIINLPYFANRSSRRVVWGTTRTPGSGLGSRPARITSCTPAHFWRDYLHNGMRQRSACRARPVACLRTSAPTWLRSPRGSASSTRPRSWPRARSHPYFGVLK